MASRLQPAPLLHSSDWSIILQYIPTIPGCTIVIRYCHGRHLGSGNCDCTRECASGNTRFPIGCSAGRLRSWLFDCRCISFSLYALFDVHDIIAVVNLTVVPHSSHSWRSLFWVAAGITFFAACLRAVLPESEIFLRAKEERQRTEGKGVSAANKTRIFLREAKTMLKQHWVLCIYAVLLMTGTTTLPKL